MRFISGHGELTIEVTLGNLGVEEMLHWENTSSASAALAAFQLLHQNVGTASTAVQSAPFGPFSNNGTCTHGCCGKAGWGWKADFTASAQGSFGPALASSDLLGGYGNAIAPTSQWIGTLANNGAALTQAIASIKQIDAAIVQAGGNATPAQLSALGTAFSSALNAVELSATQADNALQTLASFINYWNPQQNIMQTVDTNWQSSTDTFIQNKMNDLIGQLPCGSGDVTAQFMVLQASIDTACAALKPPFIAVDSQFIAALSAASVVAGVYTVLQSDHTLVSTNLTTAQGLAPTSVLRTMHLNIASSEWATLVSHAQALVA
ncbi:MAG TPA: hypothetical protein VF552_05355 [Allosphingosinicella sp.]|jgi:hypothetical protein